MSDAPTILVKKADGTSVHMTLDEFKAYRGRKPGANSQPSTRAQAEGEPIEVTTAEPVAHLPATPAPSEKKQNPVQWNEGDHSSPLVESIPKQSTPVTSPASLPATLDERVVAVIAGLKTPVAQHLKGRLQSLVFSRLKDIRSDEQLKDYLTRSEANGGMGMTAEGATEVLRATAAMAPKKAVMTPKKSVTAPVKPAVPRLAAPVKTQPPTPLMKPPVVGERARVPFVKPMMHDVVEKEIEKTGVGPLDELEAFTLDDFRKLGATTVDRQVKLLQKFEFLRSESYLLYQEGCEAWHKSPLYHAYQAAILHALSAKQTLVADLSVNAPQQTLRPEEVNALIELNQRLV